jgi:hypothetical protein
MPRPKTDFTELTQVGEWAWKSDLLWSKIRKGEDADDCWAWLGSSSINSNLFGAYKNKFQQMTQATRIIYREVTGEDCEDLSFKHTCGNKHCCNPAHVETYPNNRKFYADGSLRQPGQVPPSLRREKKEPKRAKKPTTMTTKKAKEWYEV